MAVKHTQIIHDVCKEILLPLGVFQKGSSRTYLDDNGWFFTVIEFQPSDWDRGTYLNIGLCLLWNGRDYLSFDLSRGSARQGGFVAYKNDEQFRQEMIKYAKLAKKQILYFRKLRNPKLAKWWMLCFCRKAGFDRRMLCALADAPKAMASKAYVLSRIQKSREFWHSQPSMKHMPHFPEFEGAPL